MPFKSVAVIFLISVICVQLWLPAVNSNCELDPRQGSPRPPFESRRQWKFPGPARRPKTVITEEPFDPRKENANFTGTPHVDDICTTKELPPVPTTTLFRVSFTEDCDYLAFYCMRAYVTGQVCGRTFYYQYETFENYCMLDYVNCMERYEVWKIIHMGKCFVVQAFKEYDPIWFWARVYTCGSILLNPRGGLCQGWNDDDYEDDLVELYIQYSYKDDYYLKHMIVKDT